MIATLRRLAVEESRALRAYVRAGLPCPPATPLKLPWHDRYIGIGEELAWHEVLPDARRREVA